IRDLIVTGVQTCALPIFRKTYCRHETLALPGIEWVLRDRSFEVMVVGHLGGDERLRHKSVPLEEAIVQCLRIDRVRQRPAHAKIDRKSTRLNSSHDQISY